MSKKIFFLLNKSSLISQSRPHEYKKILYIMPREKFVFKQD